jgi:hypothetical protein
MATQEKWGVTLAVLAAIALFHRIVFGVLGAIFSGFSWPYFVRPFYSFAWLMHLGWPYEYADAGKMSNWDVASNILGVIVCGVAWVWTLGFVFLACGAVCSGLAATPEALAEYRRARRVARGERVRTRREAQQRTSAQRDAEPIEPPSTPPVPPLAGPEVQLSELADHIVKQLYLGNSAVLDIESGLVSQQNRPGIIASVQRATAGLRVNAVWTDAMHVQVHGQHCARVAWEGRIVGRRADESEPTDSTWQVSAVLWFNTCRRGYELAVFTIDPVQPVRETLRHEPIAPAAAPTPADGRHVRPVSAVGQEG